MTDDVHPPSSEQLALLRGVTRPADRVDDDAARRHQGLVAVVWPMLEVPHLDREFEYSVPDDMADDVAVGVAVKVRFGAQQITGYVVELRDGAEFTGALKPLVRVISPQVVLTPHIWDLARRVAAFYAGSVSDVLRLAIPPRHARAEQALLDREARDAEASPGQSADQGEAGPTLESTDSPTGEGGTAPSASPTATPWRHYRGGLALTTRIAAGEAPRASWDAAPGLFGDDGWPAALAELAAASRASGRGSLFVLPDARDVERVHAACVERLGCAGVVRLSADQGPQARYTAYLKALRGHADVVVGTRAAMFAPVRDLGLVAWWDDADQLHADPHAPYPHVREVLRLRSELANAALVAGAHSPSVTVQKWVDDGALVALEPVERTSARVVVTGEDRSVERHGPAARARIPAEAWQGARQALERGPILVQVPRRGYIPALACARCRTKAACDVCHGPLGLDVPGSPPSCRWCGHVAHVITCRECGAHEVRSLVIGAGRTAEELGRAFPGVPVRRSGAPDVLDSVPDEPALVISTPGAEPVAPRGYAAAVLLDAWALLDRTGLDSGARALGHWATVASLVRPADVGGVVYLAGVPRHVPFLPVEALVRWAPRWFAARELAERGELQLPPTVRMASLEGERRAAETVADEVRRRAEESGVDVEVFGPLALGRRHMFDRAAVTAESSDRDEPLKVRYLARWQDANDLQVPHVLRAITTTRAAAREPVVTVRLDPTLDGLG